MSLRRVLFARCKAASPFIAVSLFDFISLARGLPSTLIMFGLSFHIEPLVWLVWKRGGSWLSLHRIGLATAPPLATARPSSLLGFAPRVRRVRRLAAASRCVHLAALLRVPQAFFIKHSPSVEDPVGCSPNERFRRRGHGSGRVSGVLRRCGVRMENGCARRGRNCSVGVSSSSTTGPTTASTRTALTAASPSAIAAHPPAAPLCLSELPLLFVHMLRLVSRPVSGKAQY